MEQPQIPEKMLAWQLFGAGFECLGKNDQPCEIPVPEIKEDELLVKIDAIGLCFSDVKLIRAGEKHPRVYSEDLSKDPVIPGHEAVMTIVKVGKAVEDKFEIGQRFIIQADIYVDKVGWAYGYAINGGMAEYSVINQKVLNGDEGCYLLPLADHVPAAIAALMEPWACVLASYMIDIRKTPLKDGQMLIAALPGDTNVYETGELLKQHAPEKVTALNLSEAAVDALKSALPDSEIVSVDNLAAGVSFDDIFLCNLTDQEQAEALGKCAKRNGIINFIGEYPEEYWSFDIGNIHYEGWYYQGATGADLSAGYGRNVRSKLKKGGTCWLPGGAGAMGQMHSQLAVETEGGPAKILVTDMDDARIEHLHELLDPIAKERGIELKIMNPKSLDSQEAFDEFLREFAPEGFDDIVMLVPVIPVVNNAAPFLGKDGLMNIFAGIPAGNEGSLNVKDIAEKGCRFIGSSGSRTAHLRHTLELASTGKLKPVTALAAIGGMRDLKNGLQAVIDAKFPGKTVIFPGCENMPLTPIEDLKDLGEELVDTLDDNGFYTMRTEDKMLDQYSK